MKDYKIAIDSFCNDNKDSTIYLVGEISHPGISDLDFLIVDNKPVISDFVCPFLAGGNVLIMPASMIESIKNLENLKLKHLQGEKFKIKPVHDNFKYVEVLEWLPERILKCEKSIVLDSKRQDVLLLHKSINRSIENVSRITGIDYKKIETEDGRRDKNLSINTILDISVKAGYEAWNDFEMFMFDNCIITGELKGSVNINNYYKFNDKFHALLLYFKKLGDINCLLTKKLNERCCITVINNSHINHDFDSFIKKRWLNINDIYTWFLKMNYNKGMIKYGWFL